jgi:hypothetical protein
MQNDIRARCIEIMNTRNEGVLQVKILSKAETGELEDTRNMAY